MGENLEMAWRNNLACLIKARGRVPGHEVDCLLAISL